MLSLVLRTEALAGDNSLSIWLVGLLSSSLKICGHLYLPSHERLQHSESLIWGPFRSMMVYRKCIKMTVYT